MIRPTLDTLTLLAADTRRALVDVARGASIVQVMSADDSTIVVLAHGPDAVRRVRERLAGPSTYWGGR